MCNTTGLVNMESMTSVGHCSGIHCCYDGVLVKASLPKYYKESHEGPSEMGLVRIMNVVLFPDTVYTLLQRQI